MPKNDYSEKLAAMQDTWEGSKTEHEQMFGSDSVPEGEYIMDLTKLSITESGQGNLMVGREHIICDGGGFDGVQIYDTMNIVTQRNKVFLRKYIDTMGYEPPDELGELPEILEAILVDKPKVRCKLNKTEGKDGTIYNNIIVIEVMDGDAEPETEEPGAEEPGAEEPGAEEPGTEDADAAELIASMVSFCATWDLAAADEEDFDSLKECMTANEYQNELIDDEERQLLTDLGLTKNIIKLAPAPAKKKAAKKVVKKSPAKKNSKKVVKKNRR